jgi:hypothetical protein
VTNSENPAAGRRLPAVTVLPGVPLFAPQPGQPAAQDQAPTVPVPFDPRGHAQPADRVPGSGPPGFGPPPQAAPWQAVPLPPTEPVPPPEAVPPPGPLPHAALLSPDPALADPRSPLSFDTTTPLPPAMEPAYDNAPPSTIEGPQLRAPWPATEPLSAPAPRVIWDVPNTANPAPARPIPAHAGSPPMPASVGTDEPAPQRSGRRGRHAAGQPRPDAQAPKRTSVKRLVAIAVGAAVLAGGFVAYTAFTSQSDDKVPPAPQRVNTTTTDGPAHPGTGPNASSSPAPAATPSGVNTASPASSQASPPAARPAGITLPERIGQLKRQTGAVPAARQAALLESIHASVPAARDAVLGLYGDPQAPAVVLVYRAGKGAPIPAPAEATRYPGGRQGGMVACGRVSRGPDSQCSWVDSRTVGTILVPRASQQQALPLLRQLRDSLEP